MESIVEAKQAKHLGELLQEQQEPFVLDVYLSEKGRGIRRSSTTSNDVGKKQQTKRTGRLSKLLRAFCSRKVISLGGAGKKKQNRCTEGDCSGHGVCRITREAAELDSFSSASSTTVYNSCSDSDPDERPNLFRDVQVLSHQGSSSSQQCDEPRGGEVKQVIAEADSPWRSQNGKKLQPSTGGEITRDTSVEQYNDKSWSQDLGVFSAWQEVNHSTCGLSLPKKITEDSLSSVPTFDILFDSKKQRSSFSKSNQPSGPKTSSDHRNSKQLLQQTKQLLFDCMKEVIETYGKEDKAWKSNNSVAGPEEIGKIICKKIVGWGRARGNEMSIDELVYLDYLETFEEWDDCIQQKMQISSEIGDALMEDVSNEIVEDMICHQQPKFWFMKTSCPSIFQNPHGSYVNQDELERRQTNKIWQCSQDNDAFLDIYKSRMTCTTGC